jgi:hypothetical protein
MIEHYKNLSLENLFYIDEFGVVQEEEWRDIPNFVKLYQASNLGRIKSFHFKNLKIRIQSDCRGYLIVGLTKEKVEYGFGIHQLVAMAFLGHVPCGNTIEVDHKNFKRSDNRLCNLRVITHRENADKKHLKSKSKYVGVGFCKKAKKWTAHIFHKKLIYLGRFNDEKSAKKCYDDALKAIQSGNEIIKSKYIPKGYCFDKNKNNWRAYIMINGKAKTLGVFKTKEKAISRYEEELLKNNSPSDNS